MEDAVSCKSGIYKIQNKLNGKCYVGSAEDFKRRWKAHKGYLKREEHHSIKLQRAGDKYGEEVFEFSVIEYISLTGDKKVDRGLLLPCEDYWIEALDAVENGYNIAPKAGSRLGCPHTPETRSKMRKPRSSEAKANYATAQKRREQERLSAGTPHPLEGRPKSPETIARMKAAKNTPEAKANMRKPRSEEVKANMRRPRTQEHVANIVASRAVNRAAKVAAGIPHPLAGIPRPPEAIAKRLATMAANKAKKLAEIEGAP